MSKVPLDWGEYNIIEQFEASADIANEESIYCFEKGLCAKPAGPGVAMQAQLSTRDRNTIASGLTLGEFIHFDAGDDQLEPLLLGKIMFNPAWQGQGMCKNDSRKIVSYD